MRLDELSAEMVASDAVEDAWIQLKTEGNFDKLPWLSALIAKRIATREHWRKREYRSLLSEFDEEQEGGVIIGVAAEQETHQQESFRLGEVMEAFHRFDDADRSILSCMLRGMSALDIAKEIKRAVPLIIHDLKRIRGILALPSRIAGETREG